MKFVLEPMSRVRRTLADISSTHCFIKRRYPTACTDPKIAKEFRKLSSTLRAAAYEVRHYRQVARLCGVPSEDKVLSGCRQLNLLSYNLRPEGQEGRSEATRAAENTSLLVRLSELLGIKTRYS